MYAADKNEKCYPTDVKKRAKINSWLLWEASVWFPQTYFYLVEFVVKPLLKAEPDLKLIEEKTPRFHQLAGILDAQLAKTKWMTGDELTIADIAIGAPMHLWAAQRLPLEQHPNLKRWYGDLAKQPCWTATQGAVDKALLPAGAPSASSRASVDAVFNFTKDLAQPPELYFYEDPAAEHVHAPGDDPTTIPVTDGWAIADDFQIDKHGFALKDFHTEYARWEDDEAMRAGFYGEIEAFLKQTVGAKRVLVFDHTLRSAKNIDKKLTQESNTSQRAPVSLVHCDYTAESGPTRVRQLLNGEADDLLSRRVAFINVWKPVCAVVEENPLAMCDVQTSPPGDFQKLFLRYRERTGENYVMRHSPGQKWWYFPRMTSEQVILLKTYDSAPDVARFVGHSAFKDPNTPPNAIMRESVEIRTICFF